MKRPDVAVDAEDFLAGAIKKTSVGA